MLWILYIFILLGCLFIYIYKFIFFFFSGILNIGKKWLGLFDVLRYYIVIFDDSWKVYYIGIVLNIRDDCLKVC